MKEGRRSKDAEISDNFNREKKTKPTSADLREAKLLKQKAEIEKRRQERELKKIEDDLLRIKGRVNGSPEVEVTAPESDPDDVDDAKSAYKMLQDMRWVYRNVKGRSKLLDLVKGDDKQFVFMVKELMKIEAALLSAKIRKTGEEEGGRANQNFFVVLKGLEEDKKVLEMVSSSIDIKQIARATNPDGTEMEN